MTRGYQRRRSADIRRRATGLKQSRRPMQRHPRAARRLARTTKSLPRQSLHDLDRTSARSNGQKDPRVDGIWHAVRPWSVTQRSGAASAACRGSPESRRAGLPLGDEFPCSPGAMSAVLPKLVALLRLEARETSDSSRERRKKIKYHVPRRRSLQLMQGSLEVAIDGVARGYLHVEASGLPKPVILARGGRQGDGRVAQSSSGELLLRSEAARPPAVRRRRSACTRHQG